MFISIIVTCYNQEKYIDNTLCSIFNQSFGNWECIVINDGSIDDSIHIIQDWETRDARFTHVYKENGGVSTARNSGLEYAKGSYIQFLDGDDLLEKDKLLVSILEIEKNPSLDIVFSNFKLYDDKSDKYLLPYCELEQDVFNYNNILYNWDDGFSVPIHTGLIKTSIMLDFVFPETLKAKEDWIMWICLFRKKISISFINKQLAIYRIHKESITMSSSMYQDHLNALNFLRSILSEAEYEKLLLVFIKRYYQRSLKFKSELQKLKELRLFKLYNALSKIINRVVKK